MKKILVPVDGSEAAARALRVAAERARLVKGELHVLHVDPPMHYEEMRVYVVREDLEKVRNEASRRVLEAAAKIASEEKISHTEHLRHGDVAHVIADLVKAQGMDEVVMGTRGMGTLGTLLLGSVAYRVVHFVRVPVTLVH
jgi:nucleotide-binding universal stress UspA family protein